LESGGYGGVGRDVAYFEDHAEGDGGRLQAKAAAVAGHAVEEGAGGRIVALGGGADGGDMGLVMTKKSSGEERSASWRLIVPWTFGWMTELKVFVDMLSNRES
jgi:hypothetical protein